MSSQVVSAADVSGLPLGSILWTDHGWVVVPGGVAPISLLAERAGRPAPEGEPAESIAQEFALVREGDGRVPTHGTAQRHVIAWYQAQRAHPNPAHLSLDGKLSSRFGRQDASHVGFDGDFSFGIGSKDSQHTSNARRRRAPASGSSAAATGGEAVMSSVLYRGIRGIPVRILVRVEPGTTQWRSSFDEVKTRETRVRVASALASLGVMLEASVTVHVESSDVAEITNGPAGYGGLDLPIAVAVLAVLGHIPRESLRGTMAIGELALDGSLRPVRGAAVAALGAKDDEEAEVLLVPAENEVETRFLANKPVMSFGSLSEVVSYMQTRQIPHEPPIRFEPCNNRGSYEARDPGLPPEAVHAAQQGQNLLLVGPPGAGKMMAARYIHSTLASLSVMDAKELTEIYSIAGLLQNHYACARPFRAPHHSVSMAGLIGGGTVPRPGEATLATFGVLLLDELPEFNRESLRQLSQVARSGRADFSRTGLTVAFPAHPVVIIGTANPCPCGHFGTPRCHCGTLALASYEDRLRDFQALFAMLRVDMQPLSVAQMTGGSMRRNAGDVIWQDNLLTWRATGDRGIEMVPTDEGQVQARDMLEERESPHFRRSPLDQEIDFLEAALGNGWSTVPPEDIGALTEATIVSQDGFLGDDGKWYPHPEVEAPIVYAHMNYAVEDPVELWAEGKPVFWMADTLTVSAEQRARARKEHASAMGEGYETNARKNVSAVINAFLAGRRHSEKTCSTDGERIYSYSLPIAARLKSGRVVVLDKARSPSVTTSSQINAVLSAIPSASSVDAIPGEHASNGPRSRTSTSTEVRSPTSTSTEVRSPTSTSTEAYTQGNFTATVTGGAGKGATTVHIHAPPLNRRNVARSGGAPMSAHENENINAPRPLGPTAQESASLNANAKRGDFKPPKGLSQAEEFFFKWAGHSYPAGASAKEQKQARVEQAKALAAAEAEAEDRGWTYQWDYDQAADTSWMDEEDLEELREGRTEMLDVLLKDENGNVLGSLGGVHVRATGGRDPYGRVVEAEMAQEALEAERSAGTAMALNRGQRRQARNPVFRHMDLGEIEQILGAQEIARVMSVDRPDAHARSRAAGWWDANEPDYHDAYTNLARMLKAGVLDDLVAEARGAR